MNNEIQLALQPDITDTEVVNQLVYKTDTTKFTDTEVLTLNPVMYWDGSNIATNQWDNSGVWG